MEEVSEWDSALNSPEKSARYSPENRQLSAPSSNGTTERRTPAFVPSTASADAPDMVRCRFDDTIRNDAKAFGTVLSLFSSNRVRGVGGGAIGVGGGCGCDIGG